MKKFSWLQNESDRHTVIVACLFMVMIVLVLIAVLSGQYSRKVTFKQAVPAIQASNAWRDANCKLVEKSFGIPVKEGKSVQHVNMNTYQCSDGLRYNISTKYERDAERCLRDIDRNACYHLDSIAPFRSHK